MHDAKEKGYQNAAPDFYDKTKALTQLPWKEVIITGGEPTSRPNQLKETLSSIDPDRKIRIISNGDWVLRDTKREKVLSVLHDSGREIQVDISAHDPLEIFKKKIDALKGKVPLGVQLRREETKDYVDKLQYLHSVGLDKMVEIHHVIDIGRETNQNHVDQSAVGLSLAQLAGYSNRLKNVGTYLMAGANGTRVVVNHETPYLVEPTAADIAAPTETTDDLKRKLFHYYSGSKADALKINAAADLVKGADYVTTMRRLQTELRSLVPEEAGPSEQEKRAKNRSYAVAAFKAGTPLEIEQGMWKNLGGLPKDERGRAMKELPVTLQDICYSRALMEDYYNAMAEKSGLNVEQIKEKTTQKLAEQVVTIVDGHQQIGVYPTPIPTHIAKEAPKDPDALAASIANHLFCPSLEYVDSKDRYLKSLTQDISDKQNTTNILSLQLYSLGISEEDFAKATQQRRDATKKKILKFFHD